jgi:hypothetical protein
MADVAAGMCCGSARFVRQSEMRGVGYGNECGGSAKICNNLVGRRSGVIRRQSRGGLGLSCDWWKRKPRRGRRRDSRENRDGDRDRVTAQGVGSEVRRFRAEWGLGAPRRNEKSRPSEVDAGDPRDWWGPVGKRYPGGAWVQVKKE